MKIVRHVKIRLHPRRDADVLAFYDAIEKGDRAQTVIDALRLMATGSTTPASPAPAPKKVAVADVGLDDSEGFQ